jgi:hypothetical protein
MKSLFFASEVLVLALAGLSVHAQAKVDQYQQRRSSFRATTPVK